METNYKNKKRFPVASALFLIYVVVSMASNIFCAVIKISLLSWLEEISSDIYGGGLFSSLVLVTGELENLLTTTMILLIIAAIVGAIAYILIAIFTFKTDKKPSIVYIAAIPFASIAAAVSAISAIIALSPRENEYYILANVFDLSAQLMLILTLISVLIFIVPFGLILIQPDLGTATVYIPIFFIMCFMAGVKIKYLLFLLGCGISMVIFTILPVYNTEVELRLPKEIKKVYLAPQMKEIPFEKVGNAEYTVSGNIIQIKVSKDILGIKDTFEFKWADNSVSDGDIMQFIDMGDAAPNDRFNYIYKK